MSDLTPYNKDTLTNMKRRVEKEGKKVTVLADAEWELGGLNVYVHPTDVVITSLPGGEDGPRKQYRQAWFMSL